MARLPSLLLGAALVVALALPQAARAWGDEGHQVIATLAYKRLTPKAKKAVDAILAKDKDALTAPDFSSRATWADKYRDSDRNGTQLRYRATHQWHFADVELDGGSLADACFGRPRYPPARRPVPARPGPAWRTSWRSSSAN